MKILIDTNILLDYLLMRKPHYYDAEMLLRLIQSGVFEAYVNTSSISDIAYILKKADVERETIIQFLSELQEIITFIPTTKTTVNNVILNRPSDIEDGLLELSAIENLIETIVTRDLEGFSWLPSMNANTLITEHFTSVVDAMSFR